MKKRILFMTGFALYTAFAMAQTSPVSKIMNGPAFESLVVSGPVSVELIESENTSLEALGSYEFINGIHTKWSRNQLQITFTKDEPVGNNPVKIYVKKLTNIQLEDGAKVVMVKPFHSPNMLVRIIGESYARLLNYGKINVIGDDFTVSKLRNKD